MVHVTTTICGFDTCQGVFDTIKIDEACQCHTNVQNTFILTDLFCSCSIDHHFTAFTICREDNATTIPSELVLDYYDIRLDYWQYFMPLFVFIIVFRSTHSTGSDPYI
jgi:hypothetical protein